MRLSLRQYSVLPGFKLSLGYTVFYLSLIVLLPLTALLVKASGLSWAEWLALATDARVLASIKITFISSLLAAGFNVFAGLLIAWVLVRYDFPGKKIIDALVDLPFALPTAVAGITLATLFAVNGWFGQYLQAWGLPIAYTPKGIVIALIFISLPFVVRTVEPVLAELESELEEAATCLGANRWQTFTRVIFPALAPALLTGFTLATARAIGEYGSVIFIAGNTPYESEITPLLIISKLEEYNYNGAAALAVLLLLLSFILLLSINLFQWWLSRRGQRLGA